MRTQAKLAIACLFAFNALAPVSVTAEETSEAWQITRSIPAPQGASNELRTSIKNTTAPNVAAAKQSVPKTKEEWLAYQESRNMPSIERAEKLAAELSVTLKQEQIDGVNVYWVTPSQIDPAKKDNLFVHIHGGAYVLLGGLASTTEAIVIANRVAMPVVSIDYRMPLDHPFPTAIEDVVTVYQNLLKTHPAATMAMGGTSAGSGLTLASTLKLIEEGIEVPAALFLGTPWADLTKSGDSYFTNEGIDRNLPTFDGHLEASALLYAGGHDRSDPLISPVNAKFDGFPPSYLVSGTRDLLLSDTVRVHRGMRKAGVDADLNIYEGISHGDYLLAPDTPESHEVFRELAAFLTDHLD